MEEAKGRPMQRLYHWSSSGGPDIEWSLSGEWILASASAMKAEEEE